MFFYINPYLIAAAVVPAAILMIMVYREDKYEKESPRLLLSLVLLGIVSTFAAVVVERVGIRILSGYFSTSDMMYNVLLYFVVVGLSEEGFKYLVLKLRTWKNPEFNYSYDGIVYAVFVSLGFALWENIGYIFQYGLSVALIRAVTAVPGHACFGVFMGAFYGLAKRKYNYGHQIWSKVLRIFSFIIPAFMHGCYDFSAAMEDRRYAWLFYCFVIIMFVSSFRMVKVLSKNDKEITGGYYYR